jgi:membrane AbrB-like protein
LIEYRQYPAGMDPGKLEIIAFPRSRSQNPGVTRLQRTLRVLGALGLCLAAGSLFAWLKTPIPWMIGPLLAMAVVQFSGASLAAPPFGREAGQTMVGISLGLYFTAPVVHEVSTYGLWFVALGILAITAGGLSSLVIARLAKVDPATAWFSSMPGGAAEMAVIGERHGALPDRVALANAIRMLFVVTLVPAFITYAGFTGADDYKPITAPFDAAGFAALVALGFGVGFVGRRCRIPNAYMLAPLLVTIGLTAAGISLSSVPTPVTNAAQLLLACSLGVQFQRSFLREAPRFVAALVPAGALMLVLCVLIALGLSWGSGAYLGATLLAAAPGGIAEMSITAKVLKIGVPFVTAAHVCRYIVVILFSQFLFKLFRKHGIR